MKQNMLPHQSNYFAILIMYTNLDIAIFCKNDITLCNYLKTLSRVLLRPILCMNYFPLSSRTSGLSSEISSVTTLNESPCIFPLRKDNVSFITITLFYPQQSQESKQEYREEYILFSNPCRCTIVICLCKGLSLFQVLMSLNLEPFSHILVPLMKVEEHVNALLFKSI